MRSDLGSGRIVKRQTDTVVPEVLPRIRHQYPHELYIEIVRALGRTLENDVVMVRRDVTGSAQNQGKEDTAPADCSNVHADTFST
jgi:hypothetical protein